MVKLVTSINGKIVRRGQDKISVLDNSLLYAEGLFETCLVIDDQIMFLKDHLDRLYRGAKVIGLKIPVVRKELAQWLKTAADGHPEKIKKLRLTITAGETARWTGTQGPSQVIITVAPHQIPTEPFRLHLSRFRVDQDSIFRQIKTISYIIHAAALRKAKQAKCDDALLLNGRGNIAEVTSANIFWVKAGKLYTPPLSSGCLDGITRKYVLKESERLGFKLIEQNIKLKSLKSADEVFISSSLKLIAPVSIVVTDEATFKFVTGDFTTCLRERFQKIAKV